MDELIRKKDAIDALMAERKHLLANGQKGAEHVLTHHGYNVIDELPTASKHDEFEKALVDLFAPIMECDINHPKYEDTVADIIRDVLKAYDELHPAERKDNG